MGVLDNILRSSGRTGREAPEWDSDFPKNTQPGRGRAVHHTQRSALHPPPRRPFKTSDMVSVTNPILIHTPPHVPIYSGAGETRKKCHLLNKAQATFLQARAVPRAFCGL